VPLIEQGLWQRVKSPLGRACIEARRPGRRHNASMRTEAGSGRVVVRRLVNREAACDVRPRGGWNFGTPIATLPGS
jgi:hypothetical protein